MNVRVPRHLLAIILAVSTGVRLFGAVADSNPSAVAGIWVLQQVGSIEELRRVEPQIVDALKNFDTVGFCLRYPWKAADADFTLLEEGRKIAERAGKKFSFRFMAGRHTPERVFDDGSPHYVVRAYGGKPGTEKVPTPMRPDGQPNAVFEKHYRAYVTRLAEWCRKSQVRLLHLAWYGQDWAELNNGIEVRAVPGYTYDRWYDAHTRLIDIGLAVSGEDLATEFPFSGYGPSGDTCSQFADHVWNRNGAGATNFFFQGNGWGPRQIWGSPNMEMEVVKSLAFERPVNRGLQMIQPQDYDWTATFAHLYEKNATYGEVYVPSFALAGREVLKKEIARFAAHCRERNGPTAPRGPLNAPPLLMHPKESPPAKFSAPSITWEPRTPDDVARAVAALPKGEAASPLLKLRVRWQDVDDRYAWLDAALKAARDRQFDIMVELIAGSSTPARLFQAGAFRQSHGRDTLPLPFDEAGKPNQVFEREFEKHVAHMASWCRLNEVKVLVLPTYPAGFPAGAETPQPEQLPGYTAERWNAANAKLKELGLRQEGRALHVIFTDK